jgi:hypothetical protein
MQQAIRAFDAATSGLTKMRNVGEHVDAYALGSGYDPSVSGRDLQVGDWSDPTFSWLSVELDVDQAMAAAEALFMAVRDAAHRQTKRYCATG